MNAAPTTTDPLTLSGPAVDAPPVPAPAPRLSHLFRASLRLGRIHPLYLPILRYRNARDQA